MATSDPGAPGKTVASEDVQKQLGATAEGVPLLVMIHKRLAELLVEQTLTNDLLAIIAGVGNDASAFRG